MPITMKDMEDVVAAYNEAIVERSKKFEKAKAMFLEKFIVSADDGLRLAWDGIDAPVERVEGDDYSYNSKLLPERSVCLLGLLESLPVGITAHEGRTVYFVTPRQAVQFLLGKYPRNGK